MNPFRPSILGAFAGLLLMSACSDQGPGATLSERIEANRALWATVRPQAYEYRMVRRCFCIDASLGPVDVTVVAQAVVQRRYHETGDPVPEEWQDLFPSVEGLFAILEDAVARNAHSIDITWDPERGIPLEAFIDYNEQTVDEELGFAVLALPEAP
ncbi:MAG: DUF6174 domain-containing protein [Longimicrobiales bacterium]